MFMFVQYRHSLSNPNHSNINTHQQLMMDKNTMLRHLPESGFSVTSRIVTCRPSTSIHLYHTLSVWAISSIYCLVLANKTEPCHRPQHRGKHNIIIGKQTVEPPILYTIGSILLPSFAVYTSANLATGII